MKYLITVIFFAFCSCGYVPSSPTGTGNSPGTKMGCSPATGCGSWWLNECDNMCYPTSTGGAACSTHRQCY